jgi:hypothetical protein
MRKLLLLILLIPVLSWADCPTTPGSPGWVYNDVSPVPLVNQELASNLHCEAHRCQKEIEELHKKFPERKSMDEVSASCLCKNLGGLKNPSVVMKGYISCYGMKTQTSKSVYVGTHFATEPKPKPTPTPTSSPKVSIDDAKVQCTDIGFKAGTEKFGDCVLELMQ